MQKVILNFLAISMLSMPSNSCIALEKTDLTTFRLLNNLPQGLKLKLLEKMDSDDLINLTVPLELLRKQHESGNADPVIGAIFQNNKGADTLAALQRVAKERIEKKLSWSPEEVEEMFPGNDFIRALNCRFIRSIKT